MYNAHKPVCPVVESLFLSLTASLDFEEDDEAVSLFASNEKDTSEQLDMMT